MPASPTLSANPGSTPGSATAAPLPDIQGKADDRNIPIDKVGVKGIRYPITLHNPATGGELNTVATANMYVALPHHQKGTHMSRFLEVLNEYHDSLRSDQLIVICRAMKEQLDAEEAHVELDFPYFIEKKAPVNGQPGKLDIDVGFEGVANCREDFILGIKVPATSLCPCSKEISDYGAHNQRCEMTVKVRFAPGASMWIEELFDLVEKCASTQVFSVLKRPDEKWVTEAAYDNPKFVEDIVRDLAAALNREDRVVWYQAMSENFESIHSHNAYAFIEHDKRDNA